MALNIGDNFSYLGAKPLDARRVFTNKAAMDAVNINTVYEGMVAYAKAEDKYYRLKSGVWIEFNSGSGISDWASNTPYTVGDLVIHNNNLYQCDTSHISTTTFDSTKFDVIGGSSDHLLINWKPSTEYKVNEIVYYNGSLFRCNTAHTSDSSSFATDESNWTLITSDLKNWKVSTSYIQGVVVIQGTDIYKCTTTHISGASFDSTEEANWTKLGGGDGLIAEWIANTAYSVNDVVSYNGDLYKCVTAHTSASTFSSTEEQNWAIIGRPTIDDWNTSYYYQVDDLVIYGNSLYRCTSQHISSSTVFSNDIANWKLVYADIKVWQSGTYYPDNVCVISGNKLYRCKTAHVSGATFDTTEKANYDEIVGGGTSIDDWATGTNYVVGDFVLYNNFIYKCIIANSDTNFTPSNWKKIGGIDNWQSSSNYYVGDLAIYNNILYQCTTANSDVSFTLTNWQAISATSSGGTGGAGYVKTLWEGSMTSISQTITLSESRKNFDLILISLKSGNFITQTIALLPTDASFTLHNFNADGTTYTFYSCDFTSDTLITPTIVTYNGGWSLGRIQGVKFGGEHSHISDWQIGVNYTVDRTVRYGDSLYRCKTAHTSSIFSTDIANWELLYADLKDWHTGTYYTVGVTVINDNKVYRCKTAHTSGATFADTNWNLLAGGGIEDWATTKVYKVGDIVIRENNLYKCKINHTSSTFSADIANWQKLDNIPDWSASTYYAVGDYLYYDKNLYRVTTAFTSSTTFSNTNLEMLGGTPLTTAEENAIINNFKPSSTAFNNVSNLYTTEERAIGIWIDGKTLYQKTVQVVLPSSSSSQSYSYMPSIPWGNIDTLVDVDGFVNRSDGWYVKYGVTFVSSSGSYLKLYIDWNKSTSQIYFFVDANNPGTAGQKATLTFKYTKI